jgi:F-type H+-transporting ATPase subunit epsilon
MSLSVKVITPDKVVWDKDAEEIVLPTSTGRVGILKGHVPLLTGLTIGSLRLKTNTGWISLVLMEGFAEVQLDKITILSNEAEEVNSIDLKEAQNFVEAMTLMVEKAKTKEEKIVASSNLRKAMARLQAVTG